MSHHHHHSHCGCCCSHDDKSHGCCSHDHHHHGKCHDHHHDSHDDFAHQMLEMADEAWMEVLKDKIKQEIISSHGANLDKLAKIVSESNSCRWKHKMALQNSCHEYEAKLADHFSYNKNSCETK